MAVEPAVLTVAEVAARLRIGRRQTYEALIRGEIPGVRIGKSWRISQIAFSAWLDGERSNGKEGLDDVRGQRLEVAPDVDSRIRN